MKKNIAVVCGGEQSECEVSKRSAQGLLTFIDSEKYNLYLAILEGQNWRVEIEGKEYKIDRNDFSFTNATGEKIKFDCAYVTIHGIPGEDGRLQGYFEMIGLPYTCCGVLAAAMTYNKYACNHYLQGFGVNIANDIMLRKGDTVSSDDAVEKLGLPMFVKPNVGGSSYGVTKVKEKGQIQDAIAKAFKEGDEVILESFMKGTEITCGVYKKGKEKIVFPITEVVSENEFFDYDAKYKGQVSEITPARLSAEVTKRVGEETKKIYDIIGAKGIIRVDYIITEGDKINILEVNTTPGMTATSFIPQQIKAAGLDIKDVMDDVIEAAGN